MERKEWTVNRYTEEGYPEMLAGVKDGDMVTYLQVQGENDDKPVCNITMMWNEALDRSTPLKVKPIEDGTDVE